MFKFIIVMIVGD